GPHRLRASLRFLPVLLPAERGEIQEAVGTTEVDPAAVRRVGVEDLVADGEETTQAGLLARPLEHPRSAGLAQLRALPVVEPDGLPGRVDGDVEVVVEVAAEGRVEGHRPTPLGLVG